MIDSILSGDKWFHRLYSLLYIAKALATNYQHLPTRNYQ